MAKSTEARGRGKKLKKQLHGMKDVINTFKQKRMFPVVDYKMRAAGEREEDYA